MIADSVAYCKAAGPRGVLRRRALLRRLHGATPSTPCRRCRPPSDAGASVVILCDTNGGTLPERGRRGGRRASGRRVRVPSRHPLPQRLRPGRRQHAGRRRATGRRRCRGRSTASASAAATSTWSASIANLALKHGYDVLQPGQPAAADGGVALRLRDRQHELPPRPAVRRRRAPSPTRAACTPTPSRKNAGQLRAHRPGRGRQRAPHPGQRAVRPVDHPGQDGEVRARRTTRR